MRLTDDITIRVAGIMGLAEEFEATIEAGKATEVCGRNAAGKSSLATAVMAAAARDSNPHRLAASFVRKAYISDDTAPDDAYAQLLVGDHRCDWRPASGTAAGRASSDPISSRPAVGLVDFTVRRSRKDSAAIVQAILLPPTAQVEERIEAALTELIGEQDARGALRMVRERGWEAAAEVYTDRARQAKREWSRVTHRAYGVRVADDWRPDGWVADLDGMTGIDAESAVSAARDAHAALRMTHAVSEDQRRRATEAAEQLPVAAAEASQAEEEEAAQRRGLRMVQDSHAELFRESGALDRKLQALQRLDHAPQTCPHCDKPIVVDAMGAIRLAEPPTDEQRKERSAALARKSEIQKQIERETEVAQDCFHLAARDAEALRGQVRQLEQAAAAAAEPEAPGASEQEIADAEAALERAKEQHGMVAAMVRASEAHATAARYSQAATCLGPRGPRGEMIEAGLARMQAGLAVLAVVAGWPVVTVGKQGEVACGGRPVELCSESERWRAQAALQLTVAALDGSGLVVLDRGDVLDAENRGGLNAALQRVCGKTGVTVVVCATGAPTFPPEHVVEMEQ